MLREAKSRFAGKNLSLLFIAAIFIGIISLILFSSLVYCQSIGFSAGYGFLNMNEVNKDLEFFEGTISSVYGITSSPDEISGGFFLEGSFKYGIKNINLGIMANYISSSGNFTGNFSRSGFTNSFEQNYDVGTIEILALFELIILIENSSIQPFIQLAGGVGFASAEHLSDAKSSFEPIGNFNLKETGNGNYFAGRIKGGLQFVLQNIILELAAGYRIANAGELKGDHIENGVTVKNMPVRDVSGNPIEFDYSGFFLTGGVSILL